ncbi:MAG: DNA alkylation repair protein [Patescibacteria group bacterium]|jgi:3-methyladenine DNA glycosylase AlkD
MYTTQSILTTLKAHANKRNVAGMARFGINPHNTLGISVPFLRTLAKKIGKNHTLAGQLWSTSIHEARLLAIFIEEPIKVTASQMNRWVNTFDSWDICDQACLNIFDKTPFAYAKAHEWVKSEKEFVRRAGFAIMAVMAVHDKTAPDKAFLNFLPLIKKYATDERNFVKKATNWALRQIGKRNRNLQKRSITLSKTLEKSTSPSARWIAKDALRELTSKKIND